MARTVRRICNNLKRELKAKSKVDGWELENQASRFAPPGTWVNSDLDVTPLAQRTWNSLTLLAYWFSDIISIQSWQTGSTILALGLTWREAIMCIILGSSIMGVPLALNGITGGKTHVPFAVITRASFGYYLSRYAVVVRLIQALFWHSITNYYGIGPMMQVIRAILPSFRTIPNHLPLSAGITTQQMIAYFLMWLVQFPLLLIPPYKLKWLFGVKVISSVITIVAMTIWMCLYAGGTGKIWDQTATVSGSAKSWLIMWSLNSCTSSWNAMACNIADFTRYLKKPRSALYQAVWFPFICSWVSIIGIVVTSASMVSYGSYLWDPIDIIDQWNGPGGRAAAFFAGASWLLAQICTNISATVITGANDMVNLFPKWFNIRRGCIFMGIIGGWVMVPWKIMSSASSLLAFMGSSGIFLAPVLAIMIVDFFIITKQAIDVPALYHPKGRYCYYHGMNMRALITLFIAIVPALPGLAYNVNPSIDVGEAMYIANFNWYFTFSLAAICYTFMSLIWPAKNNLVPEMIEGTAAETELTVEINPSDEPTASSGIKKRNEKVTVIG